MTVTLARMRRSDAPDLIAGNLASRAHHQPWVSPPADQAGFDAWFAKTLTGPNVALVAREAESGTLAGVVNINEIVAGAFHSAYLGFYGMADSAGRGLMSAAVAQAVSLAFEELGLHRLEANVQPDNARSLALVERLGFRREGFSPRYLKIDGEWRDHERWAVTVEDWTAPPRAVARTVSG
jgi:ribosomal-protein-alanine N-acetyltransferase